MSNINKIKNILKEFLSMRIYTSDDIFNKFKSIDNYIYRESGNDSRERFLYIEGKRENKVVLVAHADTVFTEFKGLRPELEEKNGVIYGVLNNKYAPLGADDRSGCAMLWLVRNMGHSLLIVDGEEDGGIGSNWLMRENKDIADKINNHQFIIQLDKCGYREFKCYNVGTDIFRSFISKVTGFVEPNRYSFTDICTLAKNICGVNLSTGYYHEHTFNEYLVFEEWLDTLKVLVKILKCKKLPKFKLIREGGLYERYTWQ